MTRVGPFSIIAGLVIASGLWLSASRADDEIGAAGETASTDHVTQLLSRIESLEKRIAVLEGREELTREVNAVFSPTDIPTLPAPVAPPSIGGAIIYPKKRNEPVRPAARIWLLKQTEQK